MTTHDVSDEIAIIRHELTLIEAGTDVQTAAATIRAAAYTIARLTDALDSCARLTRTHGRLDARYREDHR